MVEAKEAGVKKEDFAMGEAVSRAVSKQVLATDQFGHTMPSLQHVLTAGRNGPILLQDYHYLNMQTAFDRERTPERAVHAKGFGAHGEFRVTDSSIAEHCKARLFESVGKTTPIFVRFSAVNFERGYPDTIRDPRGFAIKFYCQDPGEGIMDWVFLNFPTFFVRDPMKGPSTIRVCKRDAQSGLRREQMPRANDAFWDFMSLNPEALHTLMFMFGDRGLPQNYRHMNGYSGHSYKVVNKNGDVSFVKFSLKSRQGVKNLNSEEEGHRIAGQDPDFYSRDLYEAIEAGQYPQWDVTYQVLPLEEARNFRQRFGFDPFEITKVWPHEQFPERKFGEIVINRNVQNYHAEVEQAAFGPGNLVSGIEVNPHDRLFVARQFFYRDTQMHRLGANYHLLPINNGSINGPDKAVRLNANMMRDGPMQASSNFGMLPGNFPSSNEMALYDKETLLGHEKRNDDTLLESPIEFVREDIYGPKTGFPHTMIHGTEAADEVDFIQPRELWHKVWDEGQRERFIKDVAGNMRTVTQEHIVQRMLNQFKRIDDRLANGIAEILGTEVKSSAMPDFKLKMSCS